MLHAGKLFGELIYSVGWTKDGRNILFIRLSVDKGEPEIAKIPAGGGTLVTLGLSVKVQSNFDLSPDGKRIVFDNVDLISGNTPPLR